MNERISELISSLDIKQKDFAQKINLKPNTLSMICGGKRAVTDRVISDICREFNVNENWLRTGEGEMLNPYDKGYKIAYLTGALYARENKLKEEIIEDIVDLEDDELLHFIKSTIDYAISIKQNRDKK